MKRIKELIIWLKYKFISKFIYYFETLECDKTVIFKNYPHLNIHKDSKVIIGVNSMINSSNFGYHLNMFSKCKLYADRPNALIKIGNNTRIHGTCIHAYNEIIIGNNCLIAANTQIIDANGHELSFENTANRINSVDKGKKISIGDNVWIAANCIILGGTKIGEGSIITTNSVVKGEVPSNCIFGGNPAKLIKQF